MERTSEFDVKLYNSSFDGDLEGVMAALAQGGRVAMRNPQGFTPLIAAAYNGHADICGLLLANGSNVNEIFPGIEKTALHFAALRGHEASVGVLLSWGAPVDPQSVSGITPLYGACQGGHLACVLTLLKGGASFTLPTNAGNLPIHIAAPSNRIKVVRTLLEHGCSPDMVSCSDNTQAILTYSFLLSAQQYDCNDATHGCSNVCSR